VGNALTWGPPRRFDFVCVKELGYVPKPRRRELFAHLFQDYVGAGGRLILGPWTEERDRPEIEAQIASWGWIPSGQTTKPHQDQSRLIRRLCWFDRPTA